MDIISKYARHASEHILLRIHLIMMIPLFYCFFQDSSQFCINSISLSCYNYRHIISELRSNDPSAYSCCLNRLVLLALLCVFLFAWVVDIINYYFFPKPAINNDGYDKNRHQAADNISLPSKDSVKADESKRKNELGKNMKYAEDELSKKVVHNKALLSLFICLLSFHPILKTLTKSYSDDTVYFLCFGCIVLHFFTYRYGKHEKENPLSMAFINICIMLFASRLKSNEDSILFMMLSFSILFFQQLQTWMNLLIIYVYLIVGMSQSNKFNGLLDGFSEYQLKTLVVIYISGFIFVVLFLPLSYFVLIKFGNERKLIHGKWDVLVVKEVDSFFFDSNEHKYKSN